MLKAPNPISLSRVVFELENGNLEFLSLIKVVLFIFGISTSFFKSIRQIIYLRMKFEKKYDFGKHYRMVD